MALTPLAIHDLAETVLGCVCAQLDQTAATVEDYPGCPGRACVVPGTPAWDSCDDPCGGADVGGQLTVHTARIYPSTEFPIPDREAPNRVHGDRSCVPAPTIAAEFVVTLLRCAPMPTEDGCPPSCDDLAASARILHLDMAAVHNALLCCLPSTGRRRRGPRFFVGQARPVGPEGGCVGVEQRLTVAMSSCGCPSEESP